MTTIQSPPTASTSTVDAQPHTAPHAAAAPEASLEHLVLELEAQARSADGLRRDGREAAREAALRAVADRRRASKLRCVGGVVGSIGSAAATLVQGSAQRASTPSTLLGIAGQGVEAFVGQRADRATARAERRDIASQHRRDIADDASDAAERARAAADRVVRTIDEVARTRHEAELAILRG